MFSFCDLLIIGKAKKSSSSKKSNTSKKEYDPYDATRKLAEAKALVAAKLIEMDNETSSEEEEEDSSDDSNSDSERRDTGSNKKGKRYNTRPFNVHPCYTSHSSSSFFFSLTSLLLNFLNYIDSSLFSFGKQTSKQIQQQ